MTKTSLEEVLAAHSGRFEQGLSTIKGMTVKFHVTQAKPRFFRPHSVPYALRSRVERALESLESEVIIERVDFSESAAPIVLVVKQSSGMAPSGFVVMISLQ